MKTFYYVLLPFLIFGITSCKKDKPADKDTEQVLVIENGAVSAQPDASISYSASLVNKKGEKTPASDVTTVTWSSSDESIATINASGQISIAQPGVSTISASVTIDGKTITAEAPLSISVPGVFAVAPSAILVDTEFPDLQLEPIYLGTGSTTYSYQSSNNSIASVSSTGMVNFNAAGSCSITVTATGLDGSPSIVVPVVVLGVPDIKLPVARIVVNPSSQTILKTETAQFSATAYDLDSKIVTKDFSWSVTDPTIATIDSEGKITPLKIGTTMVRASVDGIAGEAELQVAPDKVIIVDPYYQAIAAGQNYQYTATQYEVVRNSQNELVLGSSTTPTSLKWEIPTYGMSMFDIATVDNNGLVSVKSTASPGLLSYVIASNPNDSEIQPGVGAISVALSTNCNCGTQAATASSINLSSSNSVTLGLGQTSQIQAEVVNAQGDPVSGASLTYCSDNVQVADVDSTGEITAVGFSGTANITVCHGNLSKTITVTIQ